MLNIVLNIDVRTEYRVLHSDVEHGAEYIPGDQNIELYIRKLNIMLNIDLYSRILSSTLGC